MAIKKQINFKGIDIDSYSKIKTMEQDYLANSTMISIVAYANEEVRKENEANYIDIYNYSFPSIVECRAAGYEALLALGTFEGAVSC